jgi:hypothetical protein
MKQATFKIWNLDQLDKAFGLKQVWKSDLMTAWQNFPVEMAYFYVMLRLLDGRGWMLFKIRFERVDMGVERTLRLVEMNDLQLFNAALLIKFKIILQGIFTNTDEFCTSRWGKL